MRTKHTLLLFLLVFLPPASMLLSSCGGGKSKTEQLITLKKQRAELDQSIAKLEEEVHLKDSSKAKSVSVMVIQPQVFNAFIEVQAQITGDENVLATPQAGGVVKRILVRVGQRVGKGQTLAILDAAALESQLKAQEAQLNLARSMYDKQQKLWAQNIGTELQLLQAKANYETALSQHQSLVAQRNMYIIKSPIEGVVDEVKIKEGDMAAPAMSGIRVVSKDKLKAIATLGENYLGKVKTGDKVTLVFADINESLNGSLSYVAQAVDPVSRSFNVEMKLASNSHLHPNMSCKMKIANYESSAAIVVPVAVIQKTSGGDMLYVVDSKKAKGVFVQTGKTANGMVEILSGLKPGDKVVSAGYEDLENNTPVAIMN